MVLWTEVAQRLVSMSEPGRGLLPMAHRLGVSEDSIAISTERGSLFAKWLNFSEVQETEKLIVLVSDSFSFVFVPHRAFATEDARGEFVTRVRTWIASSAPSPAETTTAWQSEG